MNIVLLLICIFKVKTTEYSKNCCERLLSTDAVLVLFRVIKGANRSAIQLQYVDLALQVLSNVVKYYDPLQHIALFSGGKILLIDLLKKNSTWEHKAQFLTVAALLYRVVALNLEQKVYQ